jgi:predicted nucleic acid-binding protein
MVAFFDTSIHIPLLLGTLSPDTALHAVGHLPVGLSRVVASELLRGLSGRARRSVERLLARLLPLEPPS